jgi:hypothetical protein
VRRQLLWGLLFYTTFAVTKEDVVSATTADFVVCQEEFPLVCMTEKEYNEYG